MCELQIDDHGQRHTNSRPATDEQASDHDPSRRTSDMTRTDGRVTSEQTDQR